MFRPEDRGDRSSGIFHETRFRYSVPYSFLSVDAGAYLLSESARNSDVNSVVSPFAGLRIPLNLSSGSSTFSAVAFFEGRSRLALSDLARSTRSEGWDPRTGIALGSWTDLPARGFLDIYGDLVMAPRFSSSPMGTLITRLGSRFYRLGEMESSSLLNADVYGELFHQDAASLDLGTRRTELRFGLAGAVSLSIFGISNGTLQLRLYEGWPVRADSETRPRFEGLLVLAVSI